MCLMSKYCLKRVLYQDQRTAWWWWCCFSYLLLLLSHYSRVLLCATPSLGFSRQEHWSGLPFPSPMHKSESEVAQSCPTLRDPMDCSLPGSSVHGIFQARVLEWGAIAFSDLRGTEIPDPGPVNLKTHILHHAFVCSLPKETSLVNITVWPVFLASAEASSLNTSHRALLMGEAGAPWSSSVCPWRSCRAAESPRLKGRMLFLKTFFLM